MPLRAGLPSPEHPATAHFQARVKPFCMPISLGAMRQEVQAVEGWADPRLLRSGVKVAAQLTAGAAVLTLFVLGCSSLKHGSQDGSHALRNSTTGHSRRAEAQQAQAQAAVP